MDWRTAPFVDWHYPPRGMVIASCGHRLDDGDMGECLAVREWASLDADVSYGCYCPTCAVMHKTSGLLVE